MATAAVAPPGPPAAPSGEAPPVACPQCGNFWGVGSLFVRDTCGHRKCRGCVIVEGNECGTCKLQAKGGVGRPAAEPAPAVAAREATGSAACGGEGATSDASPVPESSPGDAQPNDSKVKTSPSNTTGSSSVKKDVPQQGTGKKVLDELNVTNASNVPGVKCKDAAEAEAVDDPDQLAEVDRPAAKRPPPPTHGVIKLPGSPMMYCCTICGHKFKSRSTVRYHYYCGVENKPLTCELCNKCFVSKSHYQYHMRDHAGDSPFKCDVCGKAFKQKTKLKRHSIVHTADRKFKCSTCGKLFAEASNLKVHERLHTGERPYKCEHCGRGFNEKTNYSKHVRSVHTDERPYACEMCGKCFARSENLKVHLRRHKGIRPYECPVCSLTFSIKKDMTRHMPVHDSSVRPFECDTCSQTFKRKDNLLRHIKLSHNENENEKEDEAQDVAAEKSAEGEAAAAQGSCAVGAGALEPGEANTERTATEELNKAGGPEAERVLTESSPAVNPQSKPDVDKRPAEVSDAHGGTSDAGSSRPLRKRRMRVPPDPAACSSLPVFRRNVTPPPGALPEPPRVPRHCLPAPRERHPVLRPPVPVDFLSTAAEKRPPRTRATSRKRSKRELENDSTDIEKVGFIQVPQYPSKLQTAPQPLPSQTRETSTPSARASESCGAVPVITGPQPQPSNCVRTITKTPAPLRAGAVSTIVSPRIRKLAPKPAHAAPPLPPLPACSPRPGQPMLRLLLHDTPCSDTPQPPPAHTRAEASPAAPQSAEGLGLCDIYECILKGNLGQLTGRRAGSTARQPEAECPLPAAAPQAWQPQSAREWAAPLLQERPATAGKRAPGVQKQLGTVEGNSGSAAAEKTELVTLPDDMLFAQRHFPTVQSVQQLLREQQQAEGQLALWPSVTPTPGKQKMLLDGKQPPSAESTYDLDELDTYCSFVRVHAKKQTLFCGKKSGKNTYVQEERQHSVFTEVRRPGKRMSAISDRLLDDNEEEDGALNYTLYGCGPGGKTIPDPYPPGGPFLRDGCRGPHYGSRGDKAADVFDVLAELRACEVEPGIRNATGDAGVTGGDRDMSAHPNLTPPSNTQQPPVIVGTGKLSDVPYS